MEDLIQNILQEISANMKFNSFLHVPVELQNQIEEQSGRSFVDDVLQDVMNESFNFSQNANQSSVLPVQENMNEKRLDGIKFDSSKIPEDYQCAITSEIMSDPVYAITKPDVKFERQNILRWLGDHNYHPHTRVSLKRDDLANDTELRVKIDVFVTEQVHKHDFSPCLEAIKNSPRKI